MAGIINLGHFSVCLNVSSIVSSARFYETLGYRRIGGNLNEGWIILIHSNSEIGLFEGHIKRNLLHFRGRDIFKLESKLMDRGLTPKTKAQVESDGSPSIEFVDPDGNVIYFNTAENEPTVDFNIGNLPSDKPEEKLGKFELCLSCEDLFNSINFYERLGFESIDGNPKDEGWAILKHANGIVALYTKGDMNVSKPMVLNFRGGDVERIVKELKSHGIMFTKDFKAGKNGGGSATLEDPDGNEIFFDTAPDEPIYKFNIDRI